MPFWAICKQENCIRSFKPEWVLYRELFRHYYSKGREILIELALKNNVSSRPYAEPTYILADKLVKVSKVTVS